VVEKCRDAAGSNEDGDTVAQHERLGVIDLKSISVHQRYGEWLKRLSSLASS